MFEKYSVSFFNSITETNIKYVIIEIYDEKINFPLMRKTVFSKQQFKDFLASEEFIKYFTTEELGEIYLYFQEIILPVKTKLYKLGPSHDDSKDQHETHPKPD